MTRLTRILILVALLVVVGACNGPQLCGPLLGTWKDTDGDVTFTFNRNGTVVVQWGSISKAERYEYLFGEAKELGRSNFCEGEERGGFHSPEKDIVRLFNLSQDPRILLYKMQASEGGEDSLIRISGRKNQLPKEPMVLKRVK
jgi:hypothetical protein